MSLKIDQDHSRFRNIVRGRIRQNLRKYISQGELIGRKGKEVVSIPIPQIDIPRFRYGDKQQGGAGQGAATRAGRARETTSSRWTSRSTSWPPSWARSSSCRTSRTAARARSSTP